MTDRFTVYDMFAILVPGVLFSALFVLTSKHLAGVEMLNWTGGFGDAALLVIGGYAVGALLQAVGDLTVERLWLGWRGGQPTATLLLESSELSESMKSDIMAALEDRYDMILVQEQNGPNRKQTEEATYRILKEVRVADALADRLFAEIHQMRAAAIGFAVLATLAIAGYFNSPPHSGWANAITCVVYLALCALTLWRMEDKATHFAKHVLTSCLNEYGTASRTVQTENARGHS